MKRLLRAKIRVFFLCGISMFFVSAGLHGNDGVSSSNHWTLKTIGNTALTGVFSVSNDLIRINPKTVSSAANEFHFVFQPMEGNGQITARLKGIPKDSPIKAGVMIRESLKNETPFAWMFAEVQNVGFERRARSNENISRTIETNAPLSRWLRLVREGDAFSGFYSSDGTNWTQLSADTIEMGKIVSVGLVTGNAQTFFDRIQITSARMTSPGNNASFTVPTNILLNAEITGSSPQVRRIEFFADAKKIGEAGEPSASMIWSNAFAGVHSVFAKITDAGGAEFFTEPVICKISLPSARAEFVGVDTVTKGDWKSRYGQEGFCIVRHATNYPAYAEILSRGHKSALLTYSSQPEALQLTNGNGGICAQWFTYTNMTVNVSVRDGHSHQVAFYFHDFDSDLRVQQIEVIDPATRAVLDTRKISNFHSGKYLLWSVRGAVQFRITALTGNAVINGIFFDPRPSSAESARE